MSTQFSATVVDGLLRPDERLTLPDHTRVQLRIESIGEPRDPVAAWESIKARLTQRPIHGGGQRFTRDELHERR